MSVHLLYFHAINLSNLDWRDEMNFITFPVSSTNIFPAANSTSGSQLLTEWNLRARETVATDSNIEYMAGFSYAHGPQDFEVSLLKDLSGDVVSYTTLQISEGRAIVNGHFVETLAPMTIDLLEANATLKAQSRSPLKGSLVIGIRAYYATEATVAGTLLVENTDNMYLGMQMIILPPEEFITPSDSPDDPSKVTAHLKLATFNFTNNKISGIVNLEEKTRYIPSNRLMSIDEIISGSYISKIGLNPKKLYAFAGKGTDPSTGLDTWEDVTDSLMIWDANPQRTRTRPPYSESTFLASGNNVYLVGVHKQVTGMTDDQGRTEYYAPKLLELPTADYSKNTPGIVNKSYTTQIKALAEKVEEFRTTLHGKQIMFLDTKIESTELPPIGSSWSIGDYILVGLDYTAADETDLVRAPSTMYVIIPGLITSIQYVTTVPNSDTVPSQFTGAQLGFLDWYQADRQTEPGTDDPSTYPVFFDETDGLRGLPNVDYFRCKYTYTDGTYKNYYYKVATTGKWEWSGPVYISGEIPLATETSIGGFLNVDATITDYGYVYRDEAGRLRLVDYDLLRSGTLAYQLADDLVIPSGISAIEAQQYLDEYVNQRIAFPSAAKLNSGSPNTIDIYLTLPEESDTSTLNIYNVDSRFDTAICLHISGSATTTTTINVIDCQKVKIDPSIEGSPIINVIRCGLYYDPVVFNYIRTCARSQSATNTFTGLSDISLWYQMYDSNDPNLLVDGMTVSELDGAIITSEMDYWAPVGAEANDNNYVTALKSLTFAGNGDIVGCGLLVSNQSTDNVDPGEKIVVGTFTLPQGSGLVYPASCLVKPLKVTGTFVSAYCSHNTWYVADTMFSALTQVYDPYSQAVTAVGNIAYHTKTTLVPSTISQTSIAAWEPDTFHLFYGGSIG